MACVPLAFDTVEELTKGRISRFENFSAKEKRFKKMVKMRWAEDSRGESRYELQRSCR